MSVEDFRYATRRLWVQPARTIATVGMLAIAVGLTTAVFTVADALIFTPVPFRDASRLTRVVMFNAHGGNRTVSPAVLRAWRDSRIFEAVEGVSRSTAILDSGFGPAAKRAARVTPGLFKMLGVGPIVGRGFDTSEGRAGTDDGVMLSEGLWRSAFGGDRGIVGKTVLIDGVRASIVGVMPASFRFPEWNTAVWRPVDFAAPPPALASERPEAFAKLSPNVPAADALRRATAAARAADGQLTTDLQARPLPLAGGAVNSDQRQIVPALVGGVVLVFAVLCANVCSLLLASMTARRREIQVRAALGASRTRLFGQIAVEHACVGVGAAAVGIAVAWMLVGLSRGFLPDAFLLRTLHPIDLDSRALIVAALTGVAGTIAAGLVPAWLGTRADISLVDTGRAATQSKAARGLTNALLVSEIAVACALLVGAALLVRSFAKLATVDRGLRTDGVLTAWISLPAKAYADRASRVTAGNAIERAVQSLSGVSRVALSYGIPPRNGSTHYYEDWRGDDPDSRALTLEVESYEVGPEFFDLYGIPLLEGRTFRSDDADDAAIVSERLSVLLWSGHSPVGRRFSFGSRHLEVIGVAREVRLPSLDANQDRPEFYERFKGGRSYLSVNMLCVPHCPNEAEVRLAIGSVAPLALVAEMAAPATAYIEELARPRASAALATVFGVIAALAVAGGLFSVLTFAVAARQREFGIRAAIGASPRTLRRAVYGDAVRVGAVGLALGLVCAGAVAHAIRALVYRVTAYDPRSWMMVIAVLIATMAIACWRPARTAANADPVILLRTE